MSFKNNDYPPSIEAVKDLVQGLGGCSEASAILERNRSTVWRWCEGKTVIPMADWKLLIHEKEKRNV